MNSAIVAAIASLDPKGRCVVALGGGADSAVLLAGATEAFGPDRVIGVFVNHGLEGSAALGSAAHSLCGELGVSILFEEAPVADGPDLESRARDARYSALSNVLGGADICCTGHTRDDQAETVLMRLMRGSGPTGIAGIPSVRGRFRRPLLGFTRSELREEAVNTGLPFADDPANIDERFLRSRVREHLLPFIESEFGDGFKDNLVRSAEIVRIDSAVLEDMAANVPIRIDPGEVGLPVAVLMTQPEAIAARLVRRGLAQIHRPYRGSFDDVAAVMATALDGTRRTLSSDVECAREAAEVVLVQKVSTETAAGLDIAVGDSFDWGPSRFSVGIVTKPSMQATVPRRTAVLVHAGGRLGVRGVRDGDRIDIAGGTSPVSEVLRAGGVPARKRASWMLITVDGNIAAVHGLKVTPWARPVPGQPAVVIEWEGHT
jgi:tRNA(Ile)-lysidine synthase